MPRVLILFVTLLAMVLIGLLPMFRRLLGKSLRVGDRIRLSGGYDANPSWLGSRISIDGEVLNFIADEPSPSAIVRLDEPLSTENLTSNTVGLRLRYQGARWTRSEIVHVELLPDSPGASGSGERGNWIESHASYCIVG